MKNCAIAACTAHTLSCALIWLVFVVHCTFAKSIQKQTVIVSDSPSNLSEEVSEDQYPDYMQDIIDQSQKQLITSSPIIQNPEESGEAVSFNNSSDSSLEGASDLDEVNNGTTSQNPKLIEEPEHLEDNQNSSEASTAELAHEDDQISSTSNSTEPADTSSPDHSTEVMDLEASHEGEESNSPADVYDYSEGSLTNSTSGETSDTPSSTDNQTENTDFPSTDHQNSKNKTSNESEKPPQAESNASNNNDSTMLQPSITTGKGKVSRTLTANQENVIVSSTPESSDKNAIPIIVYDDDPKWYGNADVLILDDYEVFRIRGCTDFSCKDDF